MKKLFLLILSIFPLFVFGQRVGKVYLGPMLHDNDFGGAGAISFRLNKHLNLGAGVDVTKFMDKALTNVYADVRVSFPSKISPYIILQGGRPIYQKYNIFYTELGMSDMGAGGYAAYWNVKGRYFYGGGIGVIYNMPLCGLFVQGAYRSYSYRYETGLRPYNHNASKGVMALSAGIAFYLR